MNILPLVASVLITVATNTNILIREEKEIIDETFNQRVETLEVFFESYDSPLKEHSETFVEVAEKYDLDYRLLPSISCMESSCGKRLLPESYNPFGWGIYGNNAIYFKDYDEAIETVGKGIKDNYVDKGLDSIDKMAPVYTPPNHVKWLNGVRYFYNEIDQHELNNS